MNKSPESKPSPDHETQAKAQVVELARNLGIEFSDLDRPARLRLVNTLRRELLPAKPRGRKPDPRVTAAYEDWMKGMRGVALYKKHIPGYDQCSHASLADGRNDFIWPESVPHGKSHLAAKFI